MKKLRYFFLVITCTVFFLMESDSHAVDSLFVYRFEKKDVLCLKDFFKTDLEIVDDLIVIDVGNCPPTISKFEIGVSSSLLKRKNIKPNSIDKRIVLGSEHLDCYSDIVSNISRDLLSNHTSIDFSKCH